MIKSAYICSPIIIQAVVERGSIAQLVQSTCLTSRGSQVRTLLLPQKKNVKSDSGSRSFCFDGSASIEALAEAANACVQRSGRYAGQGNVMLKRKNCRRWILDSKSLG